MAMNPPGVNRLALAAALVAAIGAGLWIGSRADRDTPAPDAPVAAALVPDAGPAVTADHKAPDPAPAPAPDPAEPALDLLRVAPDGATVLAGRAEPGATVTILADGASIAEVEADASGDFVALFDAPPSTKPRALRLETEGADGVRRQTGDVAILLPPAPENRPAAVADAPTATPAAADAETATQPAATDPAAPAAPAPSVAAAIVLTPDGVEITPVAPPTAAGAAASLSLASIDYAAEGAVRLSGSGPAGATVRAYVDDGYALDGTIDPTGRWSLELGEVAAGLYRLRIDQIGADGRVARRIETPFQRDFPAPATDAPGTVTVQPGNNLWTLARIHYGAGVLYTRIFTANSELIRDPDLIYPGQILNLPDGGPDN